MPRAASVDAAATTAPGPVEVPSCSPLQCMSGVSAHPGQSYSVLPWPIRVRVPWRAGRLVGDVLGSAPGSTRRTPAGSRRGPGSRTDRTNTPECMCSLMPASLSSWLATSVQGTRLPATGLDNPRSWAGTVKATWFIDPMALVSSAWSVGPWGGHARNRSGASGTRRTRGKVTAAAVEEEVLAHPGGQLDGLDQRHAQHVAVELDGAGHVAADQRQWLIPPNSNGAPATRVPPTVVAPS